MNITPPLESCTMLAVSKYDALLAELDALRGFATRVEAEMTSVVDWATECPSASISVGRRAAMAVLRLKAELDEARRGHDDRP